MPQCVQAEHTIKFQITESTLNLHRIMLPKLCVLLYQLVIYTALIKSTYVMKDVCACLLQTDFYKEILSTTVCTGCRLGAS